MSGFPVGDFVVHDGIDELFDDDAAHQKQKQNKLSGIIILITIFVLVHCAILGVFTYFVFFSFPEAIAITTNVQLSTIAS